MNAQIHKHLIVLGITLLALGSCDQGSSDNTSEDPKEKEVIEIPEKPTGVLPPNGEPCSDFEEIMGEQNKASIHFAWTSSENAETYILQVFDSDTEVYTQSVMTTETEVNLDKGKSYTWMVTAKNDDGEVSSNTFSFTTPGEPTGNYAPYAAEISVLFNIDTMEMLVSWEGSDADDDSLIYAVMVKENDIIIVEQSDLSGTSLEPLEILPGAVYIVEVISSDNFGNFSLSKSQIKAPE